MPSAESIGHLRNDLENKQEVINREERLGGDRLQDTLQDKQ